MKSAGISKMVSAGLVPRDLGIYRLKPIGLNLSCKFIGNWW